MPAEERRRAYLAWAMVCFFWGTTYVAIRVGVESLPPFLFAGLRFLLAGALLGAWIWIVRREPLPSRADWARLAVVGVLLLGVANACLVWASKSIPSGLAALLIAATPFWMVGLEALQPGGDRLRRSTLLGMLVGLAGLAVLMAPKLSAGSRMDLVALGGMLLTQVSCVAWAYGSARSRRDPADVSPLAAAAGQMLAAGAAQSLLGTLTGEWGRLTLDPRAWGAFLYLVLFGSIVAYVSYVYALQRLPMATVSMYTYVNPVIALLLGAALLAEPVGWREWLAVAFILAGVAAVRSSAEPQATAHPPEPRPRAVPQGTPLPTTNACE